MERTPLSALAVRGSSRAERRDCAARPSASGSRSWRTSGGRWSVSLGLANGSPGAAEAVPAFERGETARGQLDYRLRFASPGWGSTTEAGRQITSETEVNMTPQRNGETPSELADWRDRTRGFLQPLAAPSILGLFGFALSTFMVSAQLDGWYGTPRSGMFLFPFAVAADGGAPVAPAP